MANQSHPSVTKNIKEEEKSPQTQTNHPITKSHKSNEGKFPHQSMDHALHQFCCHCYHQTPVSVYVFGSVVVGLVWSLEHTSMGLILTRVFFFWFLALPW
jgi:hypothetical protein